METPEGAVRVEPTQTVCPSLSRGSDRLIIAKLIEEEEKKERNKRWW